LKNNFLSTI